MGEDGRSTLSFQFNGFEWDDDKAKANERKHKVGFEEGARIFEQDVVARHAFEGGEDRWTAIGLSGIRELAVAFTEREGSCRIISARKAARRERERYYSLLGR